MCGDLFESNIMLPVAFACHIEDDGRMVRPAGLEPVPSALPGQVLFE
jgi:hypothetical protein